MTYNISYTTTEKLKSLSERLKHFASEDNTYLDYIDTKIKSENLLLNLSLVISHIIQKLIFVERSKEVFLKIIENYNQDAHSNLTFSDFENLNWIRIVAGEILLPEKVRYFIRKVTYDESEGKSTKIPEGKEDLVRCLQVYSKECFEDTKLTIEKDQLESILNKYALHEISINFLVEREILTFETSHNRYFLNRGSEHLRHLRNDIAATLWLLVGGEDATITEFRRWFKLIAESGIWIDNLTNYLSDKNKIKIGELSATFLNEERDLSVSENEFAKIWLDVRSHDHTTIIDNIPVVEFNYESSFDFIKSVEYHEWRFHDTFDYQKTRSYWHFILRLIIQNAPAYPSQYIDILRILKDKSRPFLLWTLYGDIHRHFPEVIPYLLTDSELIPIAFLEIDEIKINDSFLVEKSDNEKKIEEISEMINQFWLEMFDFTLEQVASLHSYEVEEGELLAKIMVDLVEKVFNINISTQHLLIKHNSLRKRFDSALNKLSIKRIISVNSYPSPLISPRLIFFILPDVVSYLKILSTKPQPNHTQYLNFKSGVFDLLVELLRLANLRISETEISNEQVKKINLASNDLISLSMNYIIDFYSAKEIQVQIYDSGIVEKQKAERNISESGFEIIDWGYFYLNIGHNNFFNLIDDNFTNNLEFDKNAYYFDGQNRDQSVKIKLYLKSLMIAFISISQKRNLYEIEGFLVGNILVKLESKIKEYSITYSSNDISLNRIDAFDEAFNFIGNDIYYQSLASLLYKCINIFIGSTQNEFIENHFSASTDIRRMLTAINILNSKDFVDIISNRIREIEIQTFINTGHSLIELESTLIEAVNSDNHWELAKPLIDRIQSHLKMINQSDDNTNLLLFEINLILAFKEKDFTKINELPVPKLNYNNKKNTKGDDMKKFFTALFHIYNDKEYDRAILLLKSLLSQNAKNIRYAYYLYQTETLKAIKQHDKILLNKTNLDWDSFVSPLDEEEKKGLVNLTELINSNKIYYYIATINRSRFDLTIDTLPDKYLYDEDLIPLIYNFYLERNLHDLAFDYLEKAETYFTDNKKEISSNIQALIENSETPQLLSKIKWGFEKIRNIKPLNVPSTIPEIINDQNKLNEFILCEIVQASQILLDKIQGISQIFHEDRFNDLLLAILRLRFPVWGWSIQDQPRLGSSPTGINAGEIDILIQAGGKNIALLEALILKGGNYKKTEEHVLKCFDYINYLNRYYIIIYFKGPAKNFEKTWDKYNKDFLKIPFPFDVTLKAGCGFTDLKILFSDIRLIKVAKTMHGEGIEIFHAMINLGK